MAPIDRREHRQQRVRGAGPSAVQASFGFNFGALGARPAKQASLPPQPSARRTPVRTTPRRANGSAKPHRSASTQPSSSSKRGNTPKAQTATPHLGKRKRGSDIGANEDDGEEDELSPDREEVVRSIEKSRRVVGTVSPIREEIDEAPDELSVLEDGGTAHKGTAYASPVVNGTPVSVLSQRTQRLAAAGGRITTTPLADRLGSMKLASPQSSSRRSKSSKAGSTTPNILPDGQSRLSSSSAVDQQVGTPRVAQVDDESEDELSPTQVNSETPRIVAIEQHPETMTQEADPMEVDELSSPVQATPGHATPAAQKAARVNESKATQLEKQSIAVDQPKKRGRPRRVVPDNEDETEAPSAPLPMKSAKRGRPAKSAETKTEATPVAPKPRRKNAITEDGLEDEEQLDDLSPDKDRTAETSRQPVKRSKEVISISDGEESDEYEEPEPDDEPTPPSRPVAQRTSPKRTQKIKPSSEQPPRKRHKFLGPKHAVSVMRIKGSTVRGITVADTTRTILEETIDHSLNRMAEKLQTSQDSTRRKELRTMLNMSLSFKESLNEKLLDLQDANDVLSTNFKKMKLFKRDNAELRKDILRLQNNRQDITLEQDDVQANYDSEKARVDARNKLSEDMFSIETAIQNGRKKARKEGREDEGPQIPLSMMLGMVGQDVGSSGGGLLSNIKLFSGALERAAGWLEGRA